MVHYDHNRASVYPKYKNQSNKSAASCWLLFEKSCIYICSDPSYFTVKSTVQTQTYLQEMFCKHLQPLVLIFRRENIPIDCDSSYRDTFICSIVYRPNNWQRSVSSHFGFKVKGEKVLFHSVSIAVWRPGLG